MVNSTLARFLLIVNTVGFYIMGRDKRLAKQNKYRVPEKTLWLIALVGGAAGMAVGMRFFRHKTRHFQFKYGLPLLGLLEMALYIYFLLQKA